MKSEKGNPRVDDGGKGESLIPTTVLVLGQSRNLPKIEGITYADEAEAGFDVVAVTSEIGRSELLVALEKGRRRLAPILDFTEELRAHADYRAGRLNESTLKVRARRRPSRPRARRQGRRFLRFVRCRRPGGARRRLYARPADRGRARERPPPGRLLSLALGEPQGARPLGDARRNGPFEASKIRPGQGLRSLWIDAPRIRGAVSAMPRQPCARGDGRPRPGARRP